MTENNHTKQPAASVAFIQARWHSDIVDESRKSFITSFQAMTQGQSSIDVYDIPGAFEAPLLAKKLSQSSRYDAIVVSALVVDGGIYRHDFVGHAVISGLMTVQLETGVPIISSVLTPHHFSANDDHQTFFLQHFVKKGEEAAEACYATIFENRVREERAA